MNRDTTFVLETSAITKLAAAIFAADAGANTGRATFLRSLLAALQAALVGKPVLRVTGRAKRIELDATLAAFENVNTAFYGAVLEALPEGLNAKDKQSKTSFARSASATLRRAIKTGWNPLGIAVGNVTKGLLTAWIAEHREPTKLTPGRAEKRVVRLLERIGEVLGQVPDEERHRLEALVQEQLGGEIPQRIESHTLQRHRPAAH